jgi:glutathione S-transferase
MTDQPIVVYHYAYSPYARRIIWYLTLRGIPYVQCMQPPVMPRPDVSRLGVHYRRIPIVTIGRDVYLDTRLQLPKLEELSPSVPRLGAQEADQRALERLLSSFVIDGGLFNLASQLMPTDLPLFKDPVFFKDRSDFIGGTMSKEGLERARPGALTAFANTFDFLETGLLADGRDWILKTKEPSLADIEAVWPFHWLAGMPGALPKDKFSPDTYPKVFAWIARFQAAVEAAKKREAKPRTLTGEEAARLVTQSGFNEADGVVDEGDALVATLGLKKGDMVTVFPTDTGRSGKDTGRLVSISSKEVVIEIEAEGTALRVHAPRHGYKVQKSTAGQAKL